MAILCIKSYNESVSVTVIFGKFEWDAEKEKLNRAKHGLDFYLAVTAFLDPQRIIATDEQHSIAEPRYFCVGLIGRRVATVRFTHRKTRVRIIGAGFWRAGRRVYETENN